MYHVFSFKVQPFPLSHLFHLLPFAVVLLLSAPAFAVYNPASSSSSFVPTPPSLLFCLCINSGGTFKQFVLLEKKKGLRKTDQCF